MVEWKLSDKVSVKAEKQMKRDICHLCMKPMLLFRLSTHRAREIIEATAQPLIDKLQRAQI
jgi:RNase P subunit RPR2